MTQTTKPTPDGQAPDPPAASIASTTNTTNDTVKPHPKQKKPESGDERITVKLAAAENECAASSLKYNIKHGKLPATQEGSTSPYMVRRTDVERLLRENPNIVSKFHPRPSSPAEVKDGPSLTGLIDDPGKADPMPPSKKPTTSEKTPVKPPVKPDDSTSLPARQKSAEPLVAQPQVDPDSAIAAEPEPVGRKRRRSRRRGRGGNGQQPSASDLPPTALKALAGTTPKERLRITACLNELAGLVASI